MTAERLSESPAVDEFFDRLSHLDGVALLAMAGERQGIPQERLDRARATVNEVAEAAGLSGEVAKVQERAVHWASRPESRYTEFISPAMWSPVWNESRSLAAPAIVDAAVAIALGERLEPAARDLLLKPWLRATEAGVE